MTSPHLRAVIFDVRFFSLSNAARLVLARKEVRSYEINEFVFTFTGWRGGLPQPPYIHCCVRERTRDT